MKEPSKRVLVVDDYEPWRRFVCAALQKRPDLKVIGEASDGAEAVRLAQGLKPDLILLDVGLPSLNGIEAARQIRELSPDSKILFVSEQRSWDIAEAALHTGGNGYVLKSDANRELLPAVDAVLQGERFIGASLNQAGVMESIDQDPSSARRKDVVVPFPLQNTIVLGRHEVRFYSDDRHLVDHVAKFIGTALRAGGAAVISATPSHRDKIFATLQADGLDLSSALEQGRCIAFNVRDAVATFVVNGMLDPVRFLKLWADSILTAGKAATGKQLRVVVFGEGVNLLWSQGNAEAAIQVEKLCNQLLDTYNVDILCGYSVGGVQGDMDEDIFQRICAEHSAVHGRELTG